jgi:hypothetical protein
VVPFTPPPKAKTSPQEEFSFTSTLTRRISPAARKRWALREYRKPMPKPLAAKLERIRTRQWPVMTACAREPRFLDLLVSNPALAWAVVRKHPGYMKQPGSLGRIASLPQSEIAAWLGLPSSPSVLKILRKLHLPILDDSTMALFHTSLADPATRQRLGHLPKIGRGILTLLGTTPLAPLCSPKLLEQVATSKEELYRAPTAHLMENDLGMARDMGRQVTAPYPSVEHLFRTHRERLAEWNRNHLSRETMRNDGSFPPPPVPGNFAIQPLCSAEELHEEGEMQDNCVRRYVPRVLKGNTYIYRITMPERCTLSLVRRPGGVWERDECEIAGNCPASLKTLRMVDEWLEEYEALHP